MDEAFIRTQMLIGEEKLDRLQNSTVAIFGIGGVGGYVAEALARSAVGSFVLIDNDIISISNINRQIIATHDTVGKYKTDVMKERILSINPRAKVEVHRCFFLPDNSSEFDFGKYGYVVDAVDTVTAKIEIIMRSKAANVPVISSMGTGNKLDPTGFTVTDIYSTSVCPLAKVMRRELKKRGVSRLKVVCSTQKPITQIVDIENNETIEDIDNIKNINIFNNNEAASGFSFGQDYSEDTVLKSGARRRAVPGSVAFVPSVAGMIIAGEVVKDLISDRA